MITTKLPEHHEVSYGQNPPKVSRPEKHIDKKLNRRALILDGVALLAAGDGPWEVCNRDDKEGVTAGQVSDETMLSSRVTYASSARPASALYHAINAANSPK